MNILTVSCSISEKFAYQSESFIKKSLTCMLQLLTMTRMLKPHACSSKPFRIKCTLLFIDIPLQNSLQRADAQKEHMGLATWENAPDGKIIKADVTIAKNYLSEQEMSYLERIVTLYLDYAELQAERHIPMSMEDWAKRLDGFLEFNGRELLTGAGKISAEQAKLHAETEFEKYRIIQDKLFMSDFDRYMLELSEAASDTDPTRE